MLAGDHKQLGPVVKSQQAAQRGLGLTLFDRLMGRRGLPERAAVMLEEQYRMHGTIMAWSSREMYGDRMRAGRAVATHTLAELPGVAATEDTLSPLLLVDTAGCGASEDGEGAGEGSNVGSSKANAAEAQLLVAYVQRLVAAGVDPAEIGVITPYNAQVNNRRVNAVNLNAQRPQRPRTASLPSHSPVTAQSHRSAR